MTEQHDDEGVDWGDMTPPEQAAYLPDVNAPREGAPVYPEFPDNPHNHRFTISMTPGKPPMIVIRANTAAEFTAALNELEAHGAYANLAAADASLRTQGQMGAGLGPMSPVPPAQAAPGGFPPPMQSPGPPPFGPNVSAPSAPGFMGQPSFQSGPPQAGGWGGSAGGGSNRAEPKPQPPGWMRVNARSGPGYDAWKSMREQFKDQLKGKIQWGGKSDYWVEPSVGPWLSQQGFAVTP